MHRRHDKGSFWRLITVVPCRRKPNVIWKSGNWGRHVNSCFQSLHHGWMWVALPRRMGHLRISATTIGVGSASVLHLRIVSWHEAGQLWPETCDGASGGLKKTIHRVSSWTVVDPVRLVNFLSCDPESAVDPVGDFELRWHFLGDYSRQDETEAATSTVIIWFLMETVLCSCPHRTLADGWINHNCDILMTLLYIGRSW